MQHQMVGRFDAHRGLGRDGLYDLSRYPADPEERGRSSVVEHNLAKVGVESSNLFARSSFSLYFSGLQNVAQATFWCHLLLASTGRPPLLPGRLAFLWKP